jgi:nicotinamide riboside transporter PnuC
VAFVVEWTGSVTGAAGAMLLALNISCSGYAWLIMLVSNAAWIAYALPNRIHSMLLMQLVFTTTSLVGIYRWLM